MFRDKLEEGLGAIFKMPINRDLGQARNGCEIYYHFSSEITVTSSPGSHMLFTGSIMVETIYDNDMECYGVLTAKCHHYENFYGQEELRSSSKAEIPVSTNESGITIGKELDFAYKIEYDKVRETIKSIDWSE